MAQQRVLLVPLGRISVADRARSAAQQFVIRQWPVFADTGQPPRSFWALPNDPHPNIEAHRIAAEAIADTLRIDDRFMGQAAKAPRPTARAERAAR